MAFLSAIFAAVLGFFGIAPSASQSTVIPTEITSAAEVSVDASTTVSASAETMTNPDTTNTTPATVPQELRTMVVAGGCFWCVESDLEKIPGVTKVVSGYAGGTTENPTYENYGAGGHREVVEVTYDPSRVTYEGILIVAMKTTDPTDDDGTFADRGDKYSAAFYYDSPEEKATIDALIKEVDAKGPYDKPLAIDIEARPHFWPAEDYHQDYYKGTLTQLKYKYYRHASGRDEFIAKYWGTDTSTRLPWRTTTPTATTSVTTKNYMWRNYTKPNADELKKELDALTYKVTQEEGTERAGSSNLDKNYEEGIYVDVLSGEPLFSSKDKFDSGTGWPSFVKPIDGSAITTHEDKGLFTTRTEVRSTVADNHLGHVFPDGPAQRGGMRYCMNGVALKFIPKAEMEASGYGDFIKYL